jgi:hypothetical protein
MRDVTFAILFILVLIFATVAGANAAEGRHTAFVGGTIVGAVIGWVAHDVATPAKVEVAPAPASTVVVVEEAPREVIVVREVPRCEHREVIVVREGREYREGGRFVRDNGWRPAPVRPFPQGGR